MLSVPRVTMNGGSFNRVTSSAVEQPAQGADGDADEQREDSRARRCSPASLAITSIARMRDRADGQVDAGGEDDQRLTDGQRRDDGDLLEDQRDVRRAGASRGLMMVKTMNAMISTSSGLIDG